VSDSPTSEGIFALLGKTVVEECHAFHALVFGTDEAGDFRMLSSYGSCDLDPNRLDLEGVGSVSELRAAVLRACGDRAYGFRGFPLISDAGLFGAIIVICLEPNSLDEIEWTAIEGLTELTAISLSKTHQHQRLQKAFDDLRVSQDALVRTERFRALGQMSAGIAHDLKNLLNPLLLYTDHIHDVAGKPDEVLTLSERMEKILTRGLETVERLRDFSRLSPEDSETMPTDLNDMVHEALEISKSRLGTIQVSIQLGNPPRTLIRPSDCVTALVNLLINAADALGGKGTVVARTGESDGGVWVEVQDNGPGIPEEIKNRILEPFFTTKGDLGTGLGVSIVYAFTQRYGGRLDIESTPGHGANFRMWFPAIPKKN
jgi:signal transduction histidine kinase